MGLLMASWLTGAFGFVTGWTTRARLGVHTDVGSSSLSSRVRGRLRHGGTARRPVTLRCRHVRRGMRRIYSSRIQSRTLPPR